MPTIPTSKKDLSEVIIKSFSIYELTEIRIEGHRYPRRRISQQRIGFFRTLENATNAMNEFIKVQNKKTRRGSRSDYLFPFFTFQPTSLQQREGNVHHLRERGLTFFGSSLLTRQDVV